MRKTVTLQWRALSALRRPMSAAAPVDLSTLVIADALKRKAQAEIQRDTLRDALYEMPPTSGPNEAWRDHREHDADQDEFDG